MRPFLLISCFIYSISSFSQKHDNIWLLGYETNSGQFGNTEIDFNPNLPEIYSSAKKIWFAACQASICDAEGNLMFYTNCIDIASHNHQIMENGEGLNPGLFSTNAGSDGSNQFQGAIALPIYGEEDKYYLLHKKVEYYDDFSSIYVSDLFYTLIDMNANNGLGKVVNKNIAIASDSFPTSCMTAVRHANGRDWWVLLNKVDGNLINKILVEPNSIKVVDTILLDTPIFHGLAQAVFSPDGTKYARFSSRDITTIGQNLDVFDFDRCTGELSNHVNVHLIDTILTVGVAISPNSRFLYASAKDELWQFDLWASDFEDSKVIVAEYDGFLSPFPAYFGLLQLAPDGKIYSAVPGTSFVQHVIEYPNKKGLDCNVRQHAIELSGYNFTGISNFPNYRLGPIDGSACDTFGINNYPLAGFRYKKDSLDEYLVEFRDLSHYEPEEWLWDFGDSFTSPEVNPIHIFDTDGNYEVCLTVSNQYGSDIFCRDIQIGVVASNDLDEKSNWRIFPNPTSSFVYIQNTENISLNTYFEIYDATGSLVKSLRINSSGLEDVISLEPLANGIYFFKILIDHQIQKTGKIVVQK